MVKQGILITPVLGEVLTNLAPLRMKHSAMPETLACFASLVRRYALCSLPAYHKGKPTWLSLYLFACALTHRPFLTLCKGKCVLDGDPSECICNRTDQDNRRKDRAEVLHHKAEDLFATELAFSL